MRGLLSIQPSEEGQCMHRCGWQPAVEECMLGACFNKRGLALSSTLCTQGAGRHGLSQNDYIIYGSNAAFKIPILFCSCFAQTLSYY